MLDGAELDAEEGEEALVVEKSPVERDEDVEWEYVLEPRPGGPRGHQKEQEGEENKGEVDGVEGVAEGFACEIGRAV